MDSPGRSGSAFQQVADALGDDARLARARAGDHQQRPFAVAHRGALLGVEFWELFAESGPLGRS